MLLKIGGYEAQHHIVIFYYKTCKRPVVRTITHAMNTPRALRANSSLPAVGFEHRLGVLEAHAEGATVLLRDDDGEVIGLQTRPVPLQF